MITIKNGCVHIGNGTVLHNADVKIDEGRITDIGENLEGEGTIIDAEGMNVFPGFIDAMSVWGAFGYSFSEMDFDEKTNPITPDLNVVYAFDASNINYQELCEYGTTTVGVSPSNNNILGGQVAVFKTQVNSPFSMLVKEKVGLKASVTTAPKKTYGSQGTCPMTKMGIFGELDRVFMEAKQYDVEKGRNEKLEVVKRVLNKEMPLMAAVNTKSELEALGHFLKKYDIDVVLCNAYKAPECREVVKELNASIILGDQVAATTDYSSADMKTLKRMIEEGTLVAISSGCDGSTVGRENLLWNTFYMAQAGMESEDILTLITLNPAKILGVEDKVGSIEVGKDGDITIWKGNPFDSFKASCCYTLINGEVVYKKGVIDPCC
ncbi:amidohydrolase family protein [Clostridium polynesiense]|uniref:amidohydrolase family protein n=1 Tax=Clostridium polynesiense TaxID=1325933 RepID=UPI00058BF7B1|nr:amidohydrolase family protein [Clostridium polynesiense]